MARLRDSKGRFISANAEAAIRQISSEHGVKDAQTFYRQNESDLKGLFSDTWEARFSTDNAAGYLQRNFDRFTINNGEEKFNVSRSKAIELIQQFQRFQIRDGAGNYSLFTATMKDKDSGGSFHKLEINLPIKKHGKGYRVDRKKLEEMEENGEIDTYKKKKK